VRLRFALLAAVIVFPGLHGQAMAEDTQATIRMSWNGCDPQRPDTLFSGPGQYKLVLSAADFTPGPMADDNIGTDIELYIHAYGICSLLGAQSISYPDAWRFDESGCQSAGRFTASAEAFADDCPALIGANPVIITYYDYSSDYGAIIRVAVAYEGVSPFAGTRYTLWQLTFDHSHSVTGPTTPGVNCGGAELPVYVVPHFAYLLTTRETPASFSTTPGDANLQYYCPWYPPGGPPVVGWNDLRVPTLPTTWGRVKALYR